MVGILIVSHGRLADALISSVQSIPMLLTLASYRKGRSLGEIGSLVKRSGRRGIILAKEVFGLRRKPK